MLKTVRSEIGDLGWIIRTLTLAAIVGAVVKEMRLAPEQRTWHGRLMGVVPYDFRLPTPGRLLSAFWNPRSHRLLSDQPFGVGWAVNVPAAARVAAGLLGRLRGTGGRRSRRSSTARTAAARGSAAAG